MAMAGAAQEPELETPAMYHLWPSILGHLREHRVVVVSASPGSGKSSVLPSYLAHCGYGPVICAQPRHFAATVAAAKASHPVRAPPDLPVLPEPEMAGGERPRDVVFTTTRALLDMFGGRSPELGEFGAVVVDEAHDRTLGTDVLLGVIKAAVSRGAMGRCKFVVCTAGGGAIDGMLNEFFFHAPIVTDHAHLLPLHDVELRYLGRLIPDATRAAVAEVMAIHRREPAGDVLVFLPSVAAVEDAVANLKQQELPLLVRRYVHDHLPAALMDAMLSAAVPDGSRRVVVTTDVAETAVLVRGIKFVVDAGVMSKESAARRAAAAGYARPGSCRRLYRENEHSDLDEHTVPHIRRHGGLAKFVLVMRRHAADGLWPGFEVFDPSVTPAEVKDATKELVAAGYLDGDGNLTAKGESEAYDEE